MTDILQVPAMRGFIRMCMDGWEQGWHERNGGNLTYRMTVEDVSQCRPCFHTPGPWVTMGVRAENLAGEYFITTGSGKYFRNVEPDPAHSLGIVEINEVGNAWRIVWGLEDGGKPTSEFPSHFMNHSVRKAVTNGANRVPLPCHQDYRLDLRPAADRPGFLPRPLAERHGVSGGIPGRRRRVPLDGSRRRGHCQSHQREDEVLSGGNLGAARAVCLRPGLRYSLWTGAHH